MKRKANGSTVYAAELSDSTTETKDCDSSEVQMNLTTDTESSESSGPERLARPKRMRYDTIKVPVPTYKRNSLKDHWMEIYVPLVEHIKLIVRFNIRTSNVELRVGPQTPNLSCLIKGADFVKAFICGFEIKDAVNLLHWDGPLLMDFEILCGDPQYMYSFLSGSGNSKLIVEKITKSHITVFQNKIYILGYLKNIKKARRAISNLMRI